MEFTQDQVRGRLANVLHLGLVDIRNLALAAGNQQIADLADALEILPQFVEKCDEDGLQLIRCVLKDYQSKYHSSYDLPYRFEQQITASR